MKSFEVTTKKVYEPIWVHENFCTYNEMFINIRGRMKYKADHCIKCKHYFEIGETIALACFKNIGNKTMCVKCAQEIKI